MKKSVLAVASFAAALSTMPARAALAALPCYPAPRFTVSASEVVDGKTGLIWQRGVAPVVKTWADAKAYCPTVGANFRLPSVKELLTIVDLTKFAAPAIDTTAFPGTPSAAFWTSSAMAGNSLYAWLVDFDVGNPSSGEVVGTNQVRCVR